MRTEVIEMIYEEMRPAIPTEAMMLKAKLEPMLIKDRKTVKQKETRTEFRGMPQPGRTYEVIATSI